MYYWDLALSESHLWAIGLHHCDTRSCRRQRCFSHLVFLSHWCSSFGAPHYVWINSDYLRLCSPWWKCIKRFMGWTFWTIFSLFKFTSFVVILMPITPVGGNNLLTSKVLLYSPSHYKETYSPLTHNFQQDIVILMFPVAIAIAIYHPTEFYHDAARWSKMMFIRQTISQCSCSCDACS